MGTAGVQTIKAVEWTLQSAGRLHRTVTTLPSPASGEILVSTVLGAISPGSERILLHGSSPAVPDGSYPHQPGYLNIVEILDAPDRTLVGEKGVAVLGHRDFALIPYNRFIRIPSTVSEELAILGVLAADASHAIEVAAVESGEDCLVIGGGVLGVLTAWELCLRTNGAVRLVETEPSRRQLLKEIAFPRNIRIEEEVGRYQFHSTFDCANTPAAFRTAQSAARNQGSIVVIADGSVEDYVLSGDFFSKGLYLGKTGSHPDLRAFLNEYFARGDDRSTLIAAAFQETIAFEEFPQAYLKTLLAPPEDRRGLVPRVSYSHG